MRQERDRGRTIYVFSKAGKAHSPPGLGSFLSFTIALLNVSSFYSVVYTEDDNLLLLLVTSLAQARDLCIRSKAVIFSQSAAPFTK